MTKITQRFFGTLSTWFGQDRYRAIVFLGGFVYAWFLSQGIPLWDDDFTSWFFQVKDKSFLTYLWEWVWPVSAQPAVWGYSERPIQSLIYKFCFLISGYSAWSYFLLKSMVFGGLGLALYTWAQRVLPESVSGSRAGRLAAIAATALFLVTPGAIAAHIMHWDLAPLALLLFLVLTYQLWKFVEQTPLEWRAFPSFTSSEQKGWMKRAVILALCTYLSYKSKADLKLIPLIFALYVLSIRRHQWKLFALPVGLMTFLALPWGSGIFSKLAPTYWLSAASWIWKPATLSKISEFLWSDRPYSFFASFSESTISLAGLWGPFLLLFAGAFLLWRTTQFKFAPRQSAVDRARWLAVLWFVFALLSTGALPEVNYSFRIRFGILTLVPGTLLLAWVFGAFAQAVASGFSEGWKPIPQRFHRGVVGVAIAALAIQGTVNLARSFQYRRAVGQVMVAVDQVYSHVKQNAPEGKLALFPDFRPYDYHPDAGRAFAEKAWLKNPDELGRFPAGQTLAVSWSASLWDQVELVEQFSGCRSYVLFDLLYPCARGSGAFLMRYIGKDSTYAEAEAARGRGDVQTSWRLHNEFAQKHPGSLAGKFVLGLLAYQLKDYARAEREFGEIEQYMPNHVSVVYNRALAQVEVKQYDQAIARIRQILAADQRSYGAWINLYWAQAKAGYTKKATRTLAEMKTLFPDKPEVDRLLASTSTK